MKDIVAVRDILQFGLALGIGECEIADRGVLGGDDIERGERNRLVGERVNDGAADLCHPSVQEVIIQYEDLGFCGKAQCQDRKSGEKSSFHAENQYRCIYFRRLNPLKVNYIFTFLP